MIGVLFLLERVNAMNNKILQTLAFLGVFIIGSKLMEDKKVVTKESPSKTDTNASKAINTNSVGTANVNIANKVNTKDEKVAISAQPKLDIEVMPDRIVEEEKEDRAIATKPDKKEKKKPNSAIFSA